MRGFTRDKILFLCSLTAILALIGVSMFSMRFEVKADNASADTLVVSAVMCENGKKLSLTIDEKITKNDLKIDEKYIRLKDSSGGIIPLDLKNAEVSGEGAIIIFSQVKIDLNRLKNSTLSLKKGFKVSENGKTLSCDVVWEVNSFEEDNGNILYKPKINFKYSGAAKITLYVGETIKLNSICDPDPKCVGGRWSSESGKIATVKNDVLTAVSVGMTNLRLTFKDGYEYLINVVVKKGSYHQSESGESPKETAESLSESSSGSVSDSRNSETEDMSESYPAEESISESESEFESEFTSESESEYESEFESGSVSESDSVSESEGESETMSEGDRESESEVETARDGESESEVETASDGKSEENSDKESENYSDESSDNESSSERECSSEIESSSERESEHDGSGSESGKTDESGNADERGKTDESDRTIERGKTDESDEIDESDRTSESGETDESDKSSGSGGMSGRTTSNTTSGAAGGSDNSGEIGKDGTEKNGRKIVIPLICIAALLVIGVLLISKKGDPHA